MKKYLPGRESNRGPFCQQASALPTELQKPSYIWDVENFDLLPQTSDQYWSTLVRFEMLLEEKIGKISIMAGFGSRRNNWFVMACDSTSKSKIYISKDPKSKTSET